MRLPTFVHLLVGLLLVGLALNGCAPAPEPVPQDYAVAVSSTPSGATVTRDGVLLGSTPFSIRLAPGSYVFNFTLADYLSANATVVVSTEPSTVQVKLDPIIEAPIILRINAGGPQYVARSGVVWLADQGYALDTNTGEFYAAIDATEDDALYQTERWAPNGDTGLRYELPVSIGAYLVRLHFAEIYPEAFGQGKRVFSVSVENQTILQDFDIFAEAGPNTALIKESIATVLDGNLSIHLVHGTENPKVCGIEVIKLTSPAPYATLSAQHVEFPATRVNKTPSIQQLFVTNTGAEPLEILRWQKSGEHAADFIIGANASYRLASGETVVINVLFLPSAAGNRAAELVFTTNAPLEPAHLTLAGVGVTVSEGE